MAFLAITAAFYSNAIYNAYLVNAKASEILSKMQQVKNAMIAWQLDNNGMNSPITDPTGTIPTCTDTYNDLNVCFAETLTYNDNYLSSMKMAPYTGLDSVNRDESQGTPDPHINFGTYGNFMSETSGGFNRAYMKIQSYAFPDPTKWAVLWTINTSSYASFAGATNGIAQSQATYFMSQICHKINQTIGQETASGTYPNLPSGITGMNNNNITGTAHPFN